MEYSDVVKLCAEVGCEVITQKECYINRSQKIILRCSCGDFFETTIVYFIHENKKQCNKCGRLKNSGENSVLWKGGTSKERDIVKATDEYKQWKNDVFKRDNYSCQCCGAKNKKLNAHHLYGFSEYPSCRFILANGITLCQGCHDPSKYNSFHYMYGAKRFYPEDLYEYIQFINSDKIKA